MVGILLFKDLFDDFKKRYTIGRQIRGTDLLVLKSVLVGSPFAELANNCDYFFWGERTVGGYRRIGVFAFYKSRYVYISKSQCAGKSKKTHKSKVLEALRNIVASQIADYRKNYDGNWICPLSNLNLRNLPKADIHVDHVVSFKYLVEDWLTLHKLEWKAIEVCGRAGRTRSLKDKQLLESWYDYHLQHAKLQLTYAKANIQKGAKR